ncbi:M20 family metallopeptidase [Bacillus sp. CGMCC 1.16607]|uniref:M20 family metallopeptidase n=1 Tax=Bacillus sp. CGMCC 1.16607 TaxID=3351842 RepID=UPI0036427115
MKEKLNETIDLLQSDIVTLLQKMIQIPSVNPPGEYEEICDYLEKELSSYSFQVQVIDVPESIVKEKGLSTPRKNVIATLKGNGTGPSLILNAHLDTVPEDDESKWTYPPFSGMIKDGKIYGRGATDSKGRLAAYIGAAIALKQSGIPLSGDIIIAATCDEETGGELGAGYVTSHGFLTGDYALVEGYSQEIIRAMAGMTQLRIVSNGKPAHSGFKWNGINAIEKMSKVIIGLENLQKELQNEPSSIEGMKYTTINVGVIKGGTKLNVVPGSCEIEVDLRIIPEHTIESMISRIKIMIQKLQDADSEMNISVEKIGSAETAPTITEHNHPLILALQKASMEINKKELPVIGVMGQSDARWFIKNGIPAINYGPGTPANRIHGYDECMEIADLMNTTKVISRFCVNVVCNEMTVNEGVR